MTLGKASRPAADAPRASLPHEACQGERHLPHVSEGARQLQLCRKADLFRGHPFFAVKKRNRPEKRNKDHPSPSHRLQAPGPPPASSWRAPRRPRPRWPRAGSHLLGATAQLAPCRSLSFYILGMVVFGIRKRISHQRRLIIWLKHMVCGYLR